MGTALTRVEGDPFATSISPLQAVSRRRRVRGRAWSLFASGCGGLGAGAGLRHRGRRARAGHPYQEGPPRGRERRGWIPDQWIDRARVGGRPAWDASLWRGPGSQVYPDFVRRMLGRCDPWRSFLLDRQKRGRRAKPSTSTDHEAVMSTMPHAIVSASGCVLARTHRTLSRHRARANTHPTVLALSATETTSPAASPRRRRPGPCVPCSGRRPCASRRSSRSSPQCGRR